MTQEKIKESTAHFKLGHVVIFPTETVMGIGCAISSIESIKRVYQIKGRNLNQPTHILTANIAMTQKYADFSNPIAQKLAAAFWPGPLTLLLPIKNPNAPYSFLAKNGLIGVRMPDYQPLLTIIEQVGDPILGPSANRSGEKPPIKVREIDKSLYSLVDYVTVQDSMGNLPSTIVEVSTNNVNVIREGPITKEKISQVSGVPAVE